MYIKKLSIPEVILLTPKIYKDRRGFFFEAFNQRIFNKSIKRDVTFVQDNFSKSSKNVLRGLHFQSMPHEQGKLVMVLKGEIFDVALDIRKKSKTFGKWVGAYLSSNNKKQIWIPEGFAHGFLVMSETAEIKYKTTKYYNKLAERTIIWNDKDLKITWPITKNCRPIVSSKDQKDNNLKNLRY